MKRILSAAIIAFTVSLQAANSTEQAFLTDLSGKWSGSGKAYLKGLGRIPASCNMKALADEKSVKLDGRCGVMLFTIGLGLELKSEGNNRFSGIYSGSGTGPAKLSGVLDGKKLVMDIMWNGEVNGDTEAKMVLERTGPNSFAQTVTDKVKGDTIVTSKFLFTRS